MSTPKIKTEKKIFVSHASKDKEIADAFVDIILHGAMSIDLDEIFCISTEGTKIKSGYDWRDSIKESLISSKATFLIITPNYKESEMCLNEMGAAWVLSGLVLPTIVEPITFKTVGVIPEVTQVKKLLDEIHLDDLRDSVQDALKIPASRIASGRWTQKKKEFIAKVKKHIEANPFHLAIERSVFDYLNAQVKDLNKTIDNMVAEKIEMEQLVEELKEAKDKEDVTAIIKKKISISEVDEFKELIENVKKELSKYGSVIQKIFFKDYTRNDEITIDVDDNRRVLDEAVARKIIDEELDLNHDNSKVKMVFDAFGALDKFISSKKMKQSVYQYFEETYDCELDMSNLDFWEVVFDIKIYF